MEGRRANGFIHMCKQRVLLLNASNMNSFPVYPYAFIQVPAVGRQAGIKAICQHDPAMILITLRNTDSFVSQDYELPARQAARYQNLSEKLIAASREVSDPVWKNKRPPRFPADRTVRATSGA